MQKYNNLCGASAKTAFGNAWSKSAKQSQSHFSGFSDPEQNSQNLRVLEILGAYSMSVSNQSEMSTLLLRRNT